MRITSGLTPCANVNNSFRGSLTSLKASQLDYPQLKAMESTQILGSRLSQDESPAQENLQWWLAKGISILFSPPLLGVVGLFLLGARLDSAGDWARIGLYGAVNVVAPVLYILWLMRIGEVTDFHMRDRHERIKPLRAVLLFFFLSWLIFLAGRAPTLFQVLALIGTLQSAAMFLITLRWKISGHGAGVAGFSVLLWGLYGSVAAPAFLFIPLVIWARLSLDRHDLPQTLAGAALGGSGMLAAIALIPATIL